MPRHDNASVRQEILRYLREYIAEHGHAPLKRDLAAAVNRSYPALQGHLQALEAEGHVWLGDHKNAPIVLNDPPRTREQFIADREALIAEAARRLKALMPGLPEEDITRLAEQVGDACQRNNLTFDRIPPGGSGGRR